MESVSNSDSDWAERMKYKIRFGDIEHELLLVRNATYTTRKPKLENLSRNALGTYTKRRITDENGSFSQLMSLTLLKSTENITLLSGKTLKG